MDSIIEHRKSIPRANNMTNDDPETKLRWTEDLLVGVDYGSVVRGDIVFVEEAP